MKRQGYLRSRQRRGRWFHYYRRNGKEVSLGVHGLHPTDPRVFAAYCAEHARWQDRPPGTETPKGGSFAWAVDFYRASPEWAMLKPATRQNRAAILRRYVKAQGERPLATITRDDIEAALYARGGHAAVNELKALRPVFAYAHNLRIIPTDPTFGLKMKRPTTRGFATASADDIARFQERWALGTTERLIFDLALYTGAARADLANLGRHNIRDRLLTYRRQKTDTLCEVPITPELRAVIARTPDIAPAFILSRQGASRIRPRASATCSAPQPRPPGCRRGSTGCAKPSVSIGRKSRPARTRSPPWPGI
jgi:integrase